MSLFIAPRQFQQRADTYERLSQLTAAGVPLTGALEMIERNPSVRSDRVQVRRVLERLRQGHTFSGSLPSAGQWLPAFDIALLQAGEQSGRLPECFRLLSRHYAGHAQLARDLMANLAYPVLLLHAAVFLFPLPQLFLSGNLGSYLGQTVGVLLPFYAAGVLVLFALQGRHGEAWRAWMERLLKRVPLLGSARRAQALSHLSSALEALINAGVRIVEAWQIAALASGSPAMRRVVSGWMPALEAGRTPAELVAESPLFPEVFANLYGTGEVSGRLDESLLNLSRYYREEAARKLKLLTEWGPRLFYLAVALAVAWRILSFWTGYFKQIEDVINSVP
jgi:type II secretory pathway component PulF